MLIAVHCGSQRLAACSTTGLHLHVLLFVYIAKCICFDLFLVSSLALSLVVFLLCYHIHLLSVCPDRSTYLSPLVSYVLCESIHSYYQSLLGLVFCSFDSLVFIPFLITWILILVLPHQCWLHIT